MLAIVPIPMAIELCHQFISNLININMSPEMNKIEIKTRLKKFGSNRTLRIFIPNKRLLRPIKPCVTRAEMAAPYAL
jgi:hypothetical protein